MELPAMAVNGVVPVVSPWLVGSVALLVLGLFLALLVLMRRNWRLVVTHGLNPFSIADAQRAANPALSTLRPGEKPFAASGFGRFSLTCIGLGMAGSIVTGLWALFAG